MKIPHIHRNIFIDSFWILLLLLLIQVTQAAVFDQVTASPPQSAVALARSNTLNVTWSVQSSNANPITVELSGVRGEFRTNSQTVLGTVNTRLPLRTINLPANNTPVISPFAESLLVPAYVIDSARKLGLNQIFYVRVFSGRDITNNISFTGEGSITLNIGSSSGGSLAITRMTLSFDAGDTQRVVGTDAKLQARLKLDTQGIGRLRAVWEVAEPPSTLGEPIWRTLQHVQRSLTGSQELVLPSPLLPTRDFGIYLVRLRVLEPSLIFTEPQLLYAVEEGLSAISERINILGPQGLVRVGADTRFEWEQVAGAQAYRLDIYTQELRVAVTSANADTNMVEEKGEVIPGQRITGVLVKPDKHFTTLSDASLGHLQTGRRYFWQVQAIDAQGRVFATSPLGEVFAQ